MSLHYTRLSYDLDGNQTLIKTATGIWTVEHARRLVGRVDKPRSEFAPQGRAGNGVPASQYNAHNRPIRFTQGTTEIECGYDYRGRRFEKKVTENGTILRETQTIQMGVGLFRYSVLGYEHNR